MKKNFAVYISIILFLSSCVPQAGSSKKKKKSTSDEFSSSDSQGGSGYSYNNNASDPYGFNNNIGNVSISNNRIEAISGDGRAVITQGSTSLSSSSNNDCGRGISIDPSTGRCGSSVT